ncbi:hypothetical protein ACIRBX_34610 [Kitasatospora sp. NPDC096147]|uniref:hypothetical protein n=1 Tax=Kitasatospora sp. NPDC096147 TaxID=3364093 RepID=UPI00380B8D92
MLRDLVRGVVVVATEVAEEAGKQVTGLLVQLPPVVKRVETLAEEAVTVGRAGIDLAVGVTRAEAEKVFEKVGDQVVKVGVVLSYLEAQLTGRQQERDEPRPAREEKPTQPQERRAEGLFDQGWEQEVRQTAPDVEVEAEEDAEEEVGPDAWYVPEAEEEPAVAEPAKEAPVRKAAARKVAAKKAAPAKKAAAKKAATEQAAPVRKAATRKTVVKKTATAKKAATKKTATKKAAAKKPAPGKPTDD